MKKLLISCDKCKEEIITDNDDIGYDYFEIQQHSYCGKPGCLVLHSPDARELLCSECYYAQKK